MLIAGVGRTELTPFPGVELAGWGYYLERVWRNVHDPLFATAVVFESPSGSVVLIALDLMVIDTRFTENVRGQIKAELGLPADAIMLTCSHSHNAPAAGGLRGVGECHREYETWAARQAVEAVLQAWQQRCPVTMKVGARHCPGLTFNRTRENGVVDDLLTVAQINKLDGQPLAILMNFAAHPTVMTQLRPWDVSRDVPGQVCDLLEHRYPGALALSIQGACGDTNFLRQFQSAQRCQEPAIHLVESAVEILESASICDSDRIAAGSRIARLPTRRWTLEEVEQDRAEAQRRLAENDFSGWRETIGRSMTNRPDDMVARHGGDEAKAVRAMCRFHLEWTEQMLQDLQTRKEVLPTEVQAFRVGDLFFAANASEFFSPLAIEVRQQSGCAQLMIACYANGRIGYLPDAYDIDAKSYAGLQSPKYCNQFPFTANSGPEMCRTMLNTLADCQTEPAHRQCRTK